MIIFASNMMNSPIIRFTPIALSKIAELKDSLQTTEEQFLRVGIKGAGCGTPTFLLAFDNREEKDEIYEIQGEKVLISKGQSMYVLGMTIDYEEREESKGFVFRAG